MSMNENTISNHSEGAAVDGADSGFNEKTVTNVLVDPAKREMVFALQNEACTMLSKIIDETATILMRDAEHSTDTRNLLNVQQVARLGDVSTRRKQAWQKAREAAEMLVIGALINKDNPAWDPTDPSSCAAEGEGVLLSLIRFEAPGGDGSSASVV